MFCFSVGVCCVSLCKGAINHIHLGGRTIITAISSKHYSSLGGGGGGACSLNEYD